jgi:adenylate cyclase
LADLFISYARQDRPLVVPIVRALEAEGWSVWWDPEIVPGQEFDRLIAAELDTAKAVVVVWTPASVESRWVRGEAREAADRGILVPVRFDGARLPIDVRAIHTIDFDGWDGDPDSSSFQSLHRALRGLLSGSSSDSAAPGVEMREKPKRRTTICVLPFANMSGDPEQDYFADGICEDIMTHLSRLSALSVTSRNTAFSFKGRNVDLKQVASQLGVSHILEGSVRKSGERVRVTAQLVAAASDIHLWAERYDRDFSDIFALQDEISNAIVDALRISLLPGERKAIEQRGTSNPEAYKLFLMARQYGFTGNAGSRRQNEAIVRLCRQATDIDPRYARAWALMANAQAGLEDAFGSTADGGRAASERALALDPDLAEAHAAMARVLTQEERYDEAFAEIERALSLDAESYEVNVAAARWHFSMRHTEQAIDHFARASALVETDYFSAGMMMVGYETIGRKDNAIEAARTTRERTEKIIAAEPDNGSAMGYLVTSLIILGEVESAKEWMQRALLLDPDNMRMRYNFCCDLVLMNDYDAALDMLEPATQTLTRGLFNWASADPDLDPLRELPRFRQMMSDAHARLKTHEAE